MDASILSVLVNMGAAGAVIAVVWLYQSSLSKLADKVGEQVAALMTAQREQLTLVSTSQDRRVTQFVERLDTIDQRHIQEDRAAREQVARQFDLMRAQDARMLDSYVSLAGSIEGLKVAAGAHAEAAKAQVAQFQAISRVAVSAAEPKP